MTVLNTVHLVSLSLQQDSNSNSVINLLEAASNYSFLGTLKVPGSVFQGGVEVGIKSGAIVIGAFVSPQLGVPNTTNPDPITAYFTINVPKGNLPDGIRTLTLFGKQTASSLAAFDLFSFDLFFDTVRPAVTIAQPTTPSNFPVSSVTVSVTSKLPLASLAKVLMMASIGCARTSNNFGEG